MVNLRKLILITASILSLLASAKIENEKDIVDVKEKKEVKPDGFVTRLLDRSMKGLIGAAVTSNIQEYYGKFSVVDNADSDVYLTMLLSYEYISQTIRFHFNMKEPNHEKGISPNIYAETDYQFNTHLDLKHPDDIFKIDRAGE